MKRKVGIIFKGETTSEFTSRYLDKILEEMENPNTHFLFTDEFPVIYKFLKKRGFQNYTVYHIGDAPKFKTENTKKYTSYIEAKESIKEDSEVIIK